MRRALIVAGTIRSHLTAREALAQRPASPFAIAIRVWPEAETRGSLVQPDGALPVDGTLRILDTDNDGIGGV